MRVRVTRSSEHAHWDWHAEMALLQRDASCSSSEQCQLSMLVLNMYVQSSGHVCWVYSAPQPVCMPGVSDMHVRLGVLWLPTVNLLHHITPVGHVTWRGPLQPHHPGKTLIMTMRYKKGAKSKALRIIEMFSIWVGCCYIQEHVSEPYHESYVCNEI